MTHQVIDPLPELLLEPLHNHGFYDFIHSKTMTVTGPYCLGDGPAHGMQRVLDSAGHMGVVIVMKHSDTPHEYAKMLSCDGSMNISEGSTLMLMLGCLNANINPQHQGTELLLVGAVWSNA
jgi:hypothetical protein